MKTCIRCGLEVTWDQASGMFLTEDGSCSCGASLAGEAGVHRVVARVPLRPRPQQRGLGLGRALAQAGLGWYAGKLAADVLFPARSAEKTAMQMLASLNPEAAAELRARGSRY